MEKSNSRGQINVTLAVCLVIVTVITVTTDIRDQQLVKNILGALQNSNDAYTISLGGDILDVVDGHINFFFSVVLVLLRYGALAFMCMSIFIPDEKK